MVQPRPYASYLLAKKITAWVSFSDVLEKGTFYNFFRSNESVLIGYLFIVININVHLIIDFCTGFITE